MGSLKYILDTNAISDYIKPDGPTTKQIKRVLRQGHSVYLSQPVVYEVRRGLIKARAASQLHTFETVFAPQLTPLSLTDDDWWQAAQNWADVRSMGKQLSDVDLLLSALATRLDAVIVSDDDDFDVLPITRENWPQERA